MRSYSLTKAFLACALGVGAVPAAAQSIPYDFTDLDVKVSLTIAEARAQNPQQLPFAVICRENNLNTASPLPPEISNYTLGRLSYGLDENVPEDRQILNQLYSHYNQAADLAYAAWNIEKRLAFLTALAQDPLIEKGRTGWEHLNTVEKMSVAQAIHNHHAAAYGYMATVLKTFEEPAVMTAASRNYPKGILVIRHGYAQNGEIFLNVFDTKSAELNTVFNTEFQEFASLVAHESDHKSAMRLIMQYKNYTLDRGSIDPAVKAMASVLYHTRTGNAYMSVSVSGFERYLSNPIEVNAREMQRHTNFFLRQNEQGKQNYLKRWQDKLSDLQNYNAALARQDAMISADTPCAKFLPQPQ